MCRAQQANVTELIDAVDAARSASELVNAIKALADANHEESAPTLIAALAYNNPGAAMMAVNGLVALGDKIVPTLLSQIDGYTYGARAWAVLTLAQIGHPDALDTLLEALKPDFAMSVRRASARGVGMLRWECLPAADIESAQAKALEGLLSMGTDPEWIVRYATVVGLQALAIAVLPTRSDWHTQIYDCFATMLTHDDSLAVRTRVRRAQQVISDFIHSQTDGTSGTVDEDWQGILAKLYQRKAQERPLEEGDPRRFKAVAATLSSLNPD